MSRFLMGLLAASLLAGPAFAEIMPAAIKGGDDLIGHAPYSPNQTYRVYSMGNEKDGFVPIQLTFSPGERVMLIAGLLVSQDKKAATDWFAASRYNVVTLQALKSEPVSAVMINTTYRGPDGDVEERHYPVLIETRDGDLSKPNKGMYLELIFSYPPESTAAQRSAWRAAKEEAKAARANLIREQEMQQSGGSNRLYRKRGKDCPDLAPVASRPKHPAISDDGHVTTLLYPPHMTAPDIYAVKADGKTEQTIIPNPTQTPEGDELQLPGTWPRLMLRKPGEACEMANLGYDRFGTQPTNPGPKQLDARR